MSAQKGRDMLLKLETQTQGVFTTMAGLRSQRLSLNAQTVDTTSRESTGQWRELLENAGVKRASLSGSGVFKDAQADAEIKALFFEARIANWQIIIPDFGTLAGPFQISALEYSGTWDRELTYEVSLESAGEVTFTSLGA